MTNVVVLQGRLVDTPERRTTPGGATLCRWRLAIPRRPGRDGKRLSDFVNCVAWRGLGDLVYRHWDKGKQIVVVGGLRSSIYVDRDGVKRAALEVEVEDVSFCGDRVSGDRLSPSPEATASAPGNAFEEVLFDDLPFDQ